MDHANEFPVKTMSKVFSVGRSSYYRWLKVKDNKAKEKVELEEKIKHIFELSRSTYGSPRVNQELEKAGIMISDSTVARRMKTLKITPKLKKRFKNTTDSKHDQLISPNLLDRKFEVSQLGRFWVSDITYIRLRYSFVYLTTVIDLADRMVVGWSLSNNMADEHTTIAALRKAFQNRPIDAGLVFHSDRGSQYASNDFRNLLKENECIQSMSRKGNCWDNAVAESFFKTIKVESLYRYKFETIEQVYTIVFDYINGWYNTKRIHSSLGGMSPSEMFAILRD